MAIGTIRRGLKRPRSPIPGVLRFPLTLSATHTTSPADDVVCVADSVKGNRKTPGIGERGLFNPRLIVPIAMRQQFHEKADARAVRQNIGCKGLQQGLAAAKVD